MTHDESPCTYREDVVKRTVLLHEMLNKKLGRMSSRGPQHKETLRGEEHVGGATLDAQF